MVKLLENTFRAINIGLANEVALMCDRLGLDVWEVMDAAATKPYGFMKFLPGPGLGGHCIPVDPDLPGLEDEEPELPGALHRAGHRDQRPHAPARGRQGQRILLNERRIAVNGSRVLVLGVAYKPDVSDIRESPALDVIRLLAERGAEVSFHDPHVPEIEVEGATYKSADLSDDALAR